MKKIGNLVISLNPGESVVFKLGEEEVEATYAQFRPQNGVPKIRLAIRADTSVKIDRKTFNNGGYVDPRRKPK